MHDVQDSYSVTPCGNSTRSLGSAATQCVKLTMSDTMRGRERRCSPASESDEEPPRKVRRREGQPMNRLTSQSDADAAESKKLPPPALSSDTASSESGFSHTSQGAFKRRNVDHVQVQGPAYPMSSYESHIAQERLVEATNEAEALRALETAHDMLHADDVAKPEHTYFRLEEFSIYRPSGWTANKRHAGELVSLDQLLRHGGGSSGFLVDGILGCGEERHQIQAAVFKTLTVDGYGADVFTVHDKICIQSHLAELRDVWYQLGSPATQYRRYYKPFLWLAHFTKCFVEYLLETERVTLRHFAREAQFATWLRRCYGNDAQYAIWCSDNGLLEYRTTVAANVGFLYKEAYSIDRKLCNQPLWGEIDPVNLTAIPAQRNIEQQTIVTPFAYDLFKRMYFSNQLKQLPVTDPVLWQEVRRRKEQLKLTPLGAIAGCKGPTPEGSNTSETSTPVVQEGDVVAVKADSEGVWKVSTEFWYAYVQRIRTTTKGNVRLEVLWLYEPKDTTLGAAYYPFSNELFLSDNCGCGSEAISLDQVLCKVAVEWGSTDPAAVPGFFVRQKFCTVAEEDRYSFETLKDLDFMCICKAPADEWSECLRAYKVHETVLVLRLRLTATSGVNLQGDAYEPGDEIFADLSDGELAELEGMVHGGLDPAEIVGFNSDMHAVEVRPFRRMTDNSTATASAPNELLLGRERIQLPAARIVRRCHVRLFDEVEIREKRVPCPYDRGGTGNCFFLARQTSTLPPPAFKAGFDPAAPGRPKLRGMGIFCGGGNLDRGLEDSGAAEFDYAVDWAEHALHSYRLSSKNPHAQYFLGSVDDYLTAAIAGSSTNPSIAKVGAVDLMAGGSPCPGYSALNVNKLSDQSLKNTSMVASVVAYVDFYSPKYFILENVVTMTQGMGANKDENVFSQVLAALVALGYQVQQFLMDAWSYGSCQQRSRVFIVASAPGLQPLPMPSHTHDHPKSVPFVVRNLGRSSNGLCFGKRRDDFTPFPHISIAEACEDLPDIGDGQPRLCPAFPDHRTPTEESGASRARIALVPVRPEGTGIVQAVRAGFITGGEPLDYVSKLSRLQLVERSTTYSRLHPDRLIPTLVTVLSIRDGVAGRTLHWREHRSITVMECKRAQGYRDDEVLVGAPRQQMKIIGNSVDRKVSLALGMALRASWMGGASDEPPADLVLGDATLPSRGSKIELPASPPVTPAQPFAFTEHEHHETALEPSEVEVGASPPESWAEATCPVLGDNAFHLGAHTTSTSTSDTIGSPVSSPLTPAVHEDQGSPLPLSEAQLEQIRAGGFKAIIRILEASPRHEKTLL